MLYHWYGIVFIPTSLHRSVSSVPVGLLESLLRPLKQVSLLLAAGYGGQVERLRYGMDGGLTDGGPGLRSDPAVFHTLISSIT